MNNYAEQRWSKFVLNLMMFIGFMMVSVNSYAAYDRDAVMTMVKMEANKQGVDPALALAVAHVESNFNPHAVSHKGARGVMQIMPNTARGEFGLNPALLFDPQTNIYTGIKFIKQLTQQYGRIDYALSHYNGGSRVRGRDGRLQVIPATKPYVDKVLAKTAFYRQQGLGSTAKASQPTMDKHLSALQRAQALQQLRQKNITLAKSVSQWVEPYLEQYSHRYDRAQTGSMSKREQVREWERIYAD